MHWVIQNNFMHEPGQDVMVETLERFSIPYSLHTVVPSACDPMSVDYWRPADAYVLDVCELEGGTTKIVEINTINSAGFYAGHVQDIVLALNGGFE